LRILFLSHYFPPEANAPAKRTYENCREWARLGHDVHVVTCFPSHPQGILYPGFRLGFGQKEIVDGIYVHRVPTYIAANKGVIKRSLNYLSFAPSAVWRSLRLGRFDVIVATSPQFFCAVAGWVVAAMKRTPWLFELRDLWPVSILAVGAVQPSLATRLLERLELHLYRSAAGVVCLTRSFMRDLANRGIPKEHLEFLPNGATAAAPDPAAAAAFRARLGLAPNQVIASYVGTLGMAHGLGTILDAAERLKDRSEISFVIVGDGAERSSLIEQAALRGLENVVFAGQLSPDQVGGILQATDIALVLLKQSPVFETVIPSKMFEAMAVSRPMILGVRGEAKELLERGQCGIAITPESGEELARAVANLADDPDLRRRLGNAGHELVRREFDRKTLALRYLRLLETRARVR